MSMSHDEMIAVIAHHRDGGKVEFKHVDNGEYIIDLFPSFDFASYDYRIKLDPRVLWVVREKDGSIYDTCDNKGLADEYLANNEGWTCAEYKEVLP